MSELKLFMEELIHQKEKEISHRMLLRDLSYYYREIDLMQRVSSRTSINISTLRFHQNNLDRF
jgi:hypothetical protein